jgi:RNA-directed DNA polymerase
MKAMQMQLDLEGEADGRPDKARDEFIAARLAEGPAGEDRLMETICGRENMLEALKRVEGNKGAPGVDGMKTAQLRGYLLKHWEKIKGDLLNGTHRPMPVRRAEIPKESGGVRLLGIPTALDRLVQQAAAQALSPLWEHTFSERSYGFRPGRSAHMAIGQAREYAEAGFTYVVDIDLSKFFDRVNHDRLMMRLATRIRDKRVLKLIRAYLNSGVLVGGVVGRTGEGTPQGGPLSPLLANIVLDELDRELERRGLRFVRYADDVAVYVRTPKAAERVKRSVSRFITGRLKLVVNEEKSAVGRPWHSKYLQQPRGARSRPKMGGGGRQHPQGRLAAQQKTERYARRCLTTGSPARRESSFSVHSVNKQPNRWLRDPYDQWCGRGAPQGASLSR